LLEYAVQVIGLVAPEIDLYIRSGVRTLLQLRLWVLLKNTSDLLGPCDDRSFEQRDPVLAGGWSTAQVDRRHWQYRFALDLSAQDSCARQEVVKSIHDFTCRHFTALFLYLRIGEDRKKKIIRQQLQVLEGKRT
jgi:hypothetical protein